MSGYHNFLNNSKDEKSPNSIISISDRLPRKTSEMETMSEVVSFRAFCNAYLEKYDVNIISDILVL